MSCLKDTQEHKRTQGDAIRSMSDEELASMLENISDSCHYRNENCGNCVMKKVGYGDCNNEGILEWLQSEAKE